MILRLRDATPLYAIFHGHITLDMMPRADDIVSLLLRFHAADAYAASRCHAMPLLSAIAIFPHYLC